MLCDKLLEFKVNSHPPLYVGVTCVRHLDVDIWHPVYVVSRTVINSSNSQHVGDVLPITLHRIKPRKCLYFFRNRLRAKY